MVALSRILPWLRWGDLQLFVYLGGLQSCLRFALLGLPVEFPRVEAVGRS